MLWHRSVKCVFTSLTYWPHLTWWDKLTSCIFDKSDGHNSTGYLGPSCILRLYQSPVPCYTIVYNAPETWSVVSRWPSSRLGHWSCYTNALIMSYKYIDHVIQVHWSCYTNTLILLYKYTNLVIQIHWSCYIQCPQNMIGILRVAIQQGHGPCVSIDHVRQTSVMQGGGPRNIVSNRQTKSGGRFVFMRYGLVSN